MPAPFPGIQSAAFILFVCGGSRFDIFLGTRPDQPPTSDFVNLQQKTVKMSFFMFITFSHDVVFQSIISCTIRKFGSTDAGTWLCGRTRGALGPGVECRSIRQGLRPFWRSPAWYSGARFESTGRITNNTQRTRPQRLSIASRPQDAKPPGSGGHGREHT